MDAQNFRSLQEAYLDVYNEGLGGAKDASDKERLKNRLRDIETSTNASLDSIRNKTDRVSRRLKAAQAQEFLEKHPRKKRTQKEQADIYDIILSHLLDEATRMKKEFLKKTGGDEAEAQKMETRVRQKMAINSGKKSSNYPGVVHKYPKLKGGNDNSNRIEKSYMHKLTRARRFAKEDYDLYDIILSHLLDEGYAETPEAAERIMVHMSEEWRESIVENEMDEPGERDDKPEVKYHNSAVKYRQRPRRPRIEDDPRYGTVRSKSGKWKY